MQNKNITMSVSWPPAEGAMPDGSGEAPVWPDQSDLKAHEQWPSPNDLAAYEGQTTQETDAQVPRLTKTADALGSMVMTQSSNEVTKTEAEKAAERREQQIERYLSKAAIVSFSSFNPNARKPGTGLNGKDPGPFYSHTSNKKAQTIFAQLDAKGYDTQELMKNSGDYLPQKFAKQGIYEVNTIRSEKVPGLSSITYEAHGPGYHEDPNTPMYRDGLVQSVKFILPRAEIKALARDIVQDPLLIRLMAQRHMVRDVLTKEALAPGGDYERYGRPPFEAWDARPDRRMAFRTSFDQKPDEVARIIHY